MSFMAFTITVERGNEWFEYSLTPDRRYRLDKI